MGEPRHSQPRGAPESIGAIILAAGHSRRMSGPDKTFAPLMGKPLILHTLQAFQACSDIERMVLVLAESNIEKGRALAAEGLIPDTVTLCPGGSRRRDSAERGLAALGQCHWVVVHDGARPCIDRDVLARGIAEAIEHGNAVAAVPVTDTIKVTDSAGYVVSTPPREELWAVQTPQIFPYEQLTKAYALGQQDATDDASLVERLGVQVRLYTGSYDNIKVTTQRDLALAENILARRGESVRPGQ